MSAGSAEIYELFLALAPARIGAARSALDLPDPEERARELCAALVPFAVDAALLGADGVTALARALAYSPAAPRAEQERGLDTLEESIEALSHGDESGARVDEAALFARAAELRALLGESEEPSAPEPEPSRAAATPADDETHWVPALAEDMVAAFLDECGERLDGLAERLLVLEEQSDNKELVSEVFRDLHTLKGGSAFAGLKKLNRVAHLAEDLIGELRDGKRSCDRALVDLLLETLDTLRAIVERARARAPIDVDVSDLCRRLKDPKAPKGAAAPKPAAAAPVAEKPREAAAPAAAAASTLRIEFEKVDQLLNLVGEVVLARGRLSTAAEVQGALLREVSQLRKKLALVLPAESGRPGTAGALDDLQRTERVLRETWSDLDAGLGGLGLAVGQLRDNVMKLRMVPIARLFTKYQRTVRELGSKLGKEVRVELEGADTELDKVLVERLEDPLLHLVRNAVDHGVELPDVRAARGKPRAGLVRLTAHQRGGQIVVTISDDGGGMDPERLRQKAIEKGILSSEEAAALDDRGSFDLIFRAGFSTASQVSDVSGRGVGMDVVRDAISKLKGSIVISSELGQGTRMELRLPLTLAITQVLAARVGGELVAIPLDAVVSGETLRAGDLENVADGVCLRVNEQLIPVVDLCDVLGLTNDGSLADAGESAVVIVDVGSDRLGLSVQQLLGRHEVVIKSLGPLLAGATCAAGATLIGDRVLLVVDLLEVARRAREPAGTRAAPQRPAVRSKSRAKVLVAEDSDVIREAIRRELSRAGFDVVAAEDGAVALERARAEQFDAVSTDVMMPKLDGYELTRALRKDPRYEKVPIVMVTSKDARIDTLRGMDAGADLYLTKPADAGELVRALDSLLAKRKSG
ncbi:MAG: response regulator [Myxococcales bacterium]|nr:response regulator [Myxococcales bacterium]